MIDNYKYIITNLKYLKFLYINNKHYHIRNIIILYVYFIVENMNNTYEHLDSIQLHILGLITTLVNWYGLPIDSVKQYYNDNCINHIDTNTNEAVDNNQTINPSDTNEVDNVDDVTINDFDKADELENDIISKIWIESRRDFRDKLDNGLKICPNYYECFDDECGCFHVKKEFICNHAVDNNYCNDYSCTKIIIKKCRKGNKCKDNKCSFRHINREK